MHATQPIRGAGALLIVAAAALVATACLGVGPDSSNARELLTSGRQLNPSERSVLEQSILQDVEGVVFELKNPVSSTTVVDLQYGNDGRIEFARDQDDVRVPNEQGETVAGLAVATYYYTGQPLKRCDGQETGSELVVRYDSLFGNDYVSIARTPLDYEALTIDLDSSGVEDLGYDAETDSRAFRRPMSDGSTTTIWYGGADSIIPTRFSTSNAPDGLVPTLTPTEKETITIPENLAAPDCQR